MDIYSQKSRWQVLLAIATILFMIATFWYTNSLAKKLLEGERDKVRIFETLLTKLASFDQESLNDEIGVYADIIDKVNHIPIIFEQENGELEGWNLDGEPSLDEFTDQKRLKKEIDELKKSGFEPFEGIGYGKWVWYKNTPLHDDLTQLPYIMFLLSAIFAGLGYYLFNSTRNAEQNRVWAGMAKETAHQLGTPISAIIAWIEHLKLDNTDKAQLEIIDELRNDVTRLELVADRFSKIGSAPALEKIDIAEELQQCINYMDRRAPKRVSFHLENKTTTPFAMINSHLFDWVIENLYRNALDAMDGSGTITTTIYKEGETLAIDIEDTGKGIPASKQKTVFQPGFSTKTRGWGLGLSLAKRIIENYHKGKIFVKQSKIDHGTTFAIRLPKI